MTVFTSTIVANVAGDAPKGADLQAAGVPGQHGATGGVATISQQATLNGIGGPGGAGGAGGAGGNGGRGGGVAVLDGSATVTSSALLGNWAGQVSGGGDGGRAGDGAEGLPTAGPVFHGKGGAGGTGGNGGPIGTTSGGGVFVGGIQGGTLELANSTIENNLAPTGSLAGVSSGNGGNGGNGGYSGDPATGKAVTGGAAGNGGNTTPSATVDSGGGLAVSVTGAATVVNVTFGVLNRVGTTENNLLEPGQPGTPGTGAVTGAPGQPGKAGGEFVADGNAVSNAAGRLTATNTLVGLYGLGASDCVGTVTDGGGNYNTDGTCNFATGPTNPQLGPLTGNGGPTQTMLPGGGSPALDHGVESACDAAPVSGVDQRGVPRPQGPQCDSGAVEVASPTQTNPFTVTTTSPQAFGLCTTSLCTLPDALTAAATTDGPATIHVAATGTIPLASTFTVPNTLTITGPGAGALSIAAPAPFVVGFAGQLTLSQLALSAGDDRPANQPLIRNSGSLKLDRVTLDDSGPGAPLIDNEGQTTVTGSTFTDNQSTIIQGGFVMLTGSTTSGNTIIGEFGSQDPLIVADSLTVANSTFTGNISGGALANRGGSVTVDNVTYSGNSSDDSGTAADITRDLGEVTVANTIFDSPFSCNGPMTDGGNNLETGNTCGLSGSSRANTPPQLSPLADNGGPTLTMLPAATSPAVDAGSDAICQAATVNGVDQRAVTRPQGQHCDIGAVELSAVSSQPPSTSAPPTPTTSAPPTPTTAAPSPTTLSSTSPSMEVLGPQASPPFRNAGHPSGLATTGSDLADQVALALALLFLGVFVAVAGRRRRGRHTGASTDFPRRGSQTG